MVSDKKLQIESDENLSSRLSYVSEAPADAIYSQKQDVRPPIADDDDDKNNSRQRSKRINGRPNGWTREIAGGWDCETIMSDDEANPQVDFGTGRGNDWFNHARKQQSFLWKG